jgi:precorrin-3B synthase
MLTGEQLGVLAGLASEYGDGWLELTSRANVQLRAVNRGTPASLAAKLWAAGMLPSEAHETVRNIAAPPLAGDQISGLVRALDEALCADPELAVLPGRFLFAIGRVPVDADVAAIPIADLNSSPDEATNIPKNPLFTLVLGNVDSGLRARPDEVVPTMLAAAHAFLRERTAEHGEQPAWRLRELPDGPSRVTRHIASSLGLRTTHASVALAGVAPELPIGIVEQGDGHFAVGALVPLGRLDGTAAELLARAGHLVVTTGRGVVVRDLSPAEAGRWKRDLAAAGLEVEHESRWVGVTACAGRPCCAKALADVRADAEVATRHADGLPVHWVGCARGCGSPSGAHVRVEATAAGYVVGAAGSGAAGSGAAGGSEAGGEAAAEPMASIVELREIVAGARRS